MDFRYSGEICCTKCGKDLGLHIDIPIHVDVNLELKTDRYSSKNIIDMQKHLNRYLEAAVEYSFDCGLEDFYIEEDYLCPHCGERVESISAELKQK